jgi:hypothetical protein
LSDAVHAALQPSWDCIACGCDWPCDPARVELAERFAGKPGRLSIYMAEQLGFAAPALFMVPPDDLYARFIAWTRPKVLDL